MYCRRQREKPTLSTIHYTSFYFQPFRRRKQKRIFEKLRLWLMDCWTTECETLLIPFSWLPCSMLILTIEIIELLEQKSRETDYSVLESIFHCLPLPTKFGIIIEDYIADLISQFEYFWKYNLLSNFMFHRIPNQNQFWISSSTSKRLC